MIRQVHVAQTCRWFWLLLQSERRTRIRQRKGYSQNQFMSVDCWNGSVPFSNELARMQHFHCPTDWVVHVTRVHKNIIKIISLQMMWSFVGDTVGDSVKYVNHVLNSFSAHILTHTTVTFYWCDGRQSVHEHLIDWPTRPFGPNWPHSLSCFRFSN